MLADNDDIRSVSAAHEDLSSVFLAREDLLTGALRMVGMDGSATKCRNRTCGTSISSLGAQDRNSLSTKPLSFRVSVWMFTCTSYLSEISREFVITAGPQSSDRSETFAFRMVRAHFVQLEPSSTSFDDVFESFRAGIVTLAIKRKVHRNVCIQLLRTCDAYRTKTACKW